MSAPTSSAPLVVNTRDGACWTRRTVTSSGVALYAPEAVGTCPGFVMATLPELAELGIVGRADVLPVPVVPGPQAPLTPHAASMRLAQYGERTKTWSTATYDNGTEKALHEIAVTLDAEVRRLRAERADEHDGLAMALGRSNGVEWGDLIEFAAGAVSVETKLRARVAELETERHSTNEALSDAAEQLRADRDRIAELEKREAVVAEFVAARAEYITSIRNCHPDNGHDYDRWQGHAAARRQLAELLGLPVAWPTEVPASESGAGATQ